MNPLIPLLADPSVCLRYLTLTVLLSVNRDDPECDELHGLRESSPEAVVLTSAQNPDGSITGPDVSGGAGGSPVRSTSFALSRLSFLGFDASFPPVLRAAEFLFSRQLGDGSWPLENYADDAGEKKASYDMIPLQTAIPLRGLAMAGFAADPRSENAYEWLLSRRLPDGAWPAGTVRGDYGYIAGYRRLPHSRFGCRSNTTGAALCLSYHPERRKEPAMRRALDLLLGRETRERVNLGFESARLSGFGRFSGFFTLFARFDPALVLGLAARAELSAEDPRLASLAGFIRDSVGERGLWEFREIPRSETWIAFDIRRSLALIEKGGTWIGNEPRTPFSPYSAKKRRY